MCFSSLFCCFCHGTNGVNLGFPLFYIIQIYLTRWGTGSWGWHDLLRTNIKELDLSEDDLDETDEQALARYEKEEMNMSFLSTPFWKDDWYIIICYCQCNPCSLYDWYIYIYNWFISPIYLYVLCKNAQTLQSLYTINLIFVIYV